MAQLRPDSRASFLITIDTEGDNLWAGPREITTDNVAWLPRFQTLCDRFRTSRQPPRRTQLGRHRPCVRTARPGWSGRTLSSPCTATG
jgi:hypothetical protein